MRRRILLDPLILIGILDARSFTSIWYWMGLALIWSSVTRNALGIPATVVQRARHNEGGPRQELLDWLRLILPRWRMGGTEGVLLSAGIGFALASLWVLGFRYGLQLAQALMVLLGPLVVLLVLRIRLATRLNRLLNRLDAGGLSPDAMAVNAAKLLFRHGWAAFFLSIVAMLLAVMVAAAWLIHHPLGY